MQILTGIGKNPAALVFSPDGRHLAGGDDRAHHLWDLAAGAPPLWSARHPRTNPRTFCFAPDGLSVVGRWNDHIFRRYDVRTGKAVTDSPLTELNPLLFSPDGQFAVATAGVSTGEVHGLRCARTVAGEKWEEVWLKEYRSDEQVGWAFRTLMFSSESGRIARAFLQTGGPSTNVGPIAVETFATESGQLVAQWRGKLPVDAHEGALNPAGTVVLLRGSVFYVIDPAGPASRHMKRRNASTKHLTSVAFSRDGRWLATTSNDTVATIWNTTTWEVHRRCAWNIGRLLTVCFAPDGLRCAAGSDTGQIVVWDLDD